MLRTANGQTMLEVRTVDETALVVGARLGGDFPGVRAMRLGTSNLDGRAMYLAASWESGGTGYRDGFGLRFAHHQLFRRPYSMEGFAIRDPVGEHVELTAAHPYITDLQRVAWRVRVGSRIEYVEFPGEDRQRLALRLDRRYHEVGGIIRLGALGRLSLFGASLAADDERPAHQAVTIGDSGLVANDTSLLNDRYLPHKMARINMLWGVRDLHYMELRGVDALSGTQDVPIGFQAGALFGRSLSVLGSDVDDVLLSGDFYAAAGGQRALLRGQVRAEGRRANDVQRWDGILVSGRVSQVLKPGVRQSTIASVEFSGGHRLRVPFNLTLGDREGGLRGYKHRTGPVGAARALARLESRWVLGRVSTAATGVAVFADAARLWAGDVPYGVSTPTVGSLGVSLLAAVPAQSRRLWRLDLTFAERVDGRGPRWGVRLSSADRTRVYFEDAADVARARERTLPASIYRWP
jgi:hypothetical protein